MHKIQFKKGFIKLKDIESLSAIVQNHEGSVWLMLEIALRSGKKISVGGVKLMGLEGVQTRPELLTLVLPTARDWKIRAPDKLSINLGFVSAEWDRKQST